MSESVEEYKRRVAQAGGFGRARTLTAKQRRASAVKAARARWKKNDLLGETVREIKQRAIALERRRRDQERAKRASK